MTVETGPPMKKRMTVGGRRTNKATTAERGFTPLVPVKVIESKLVKASESPVSSRSQEQGQLTAEQAAPLAHLKLEDHTKLLEAQSPLALDQPVFHPAFGYGTVAAIEGDVVILRLKRDKAVTHAVKAQDLITKSQAEVELKTTWFAGGAKAWRRAAGMWASLYKNLCLMEGKGAYGDWLKRHDLNRSSVDDLIRRFEEEVTWEAQDQLILPESGKTDEATPASTLETAMSPYAVTGGRQANERTPDPENDERQKNIQTETSKRAGIKPTRHKTVLFLQRKHLNPEMLARYHAIKADDKKLVDAIMQRKIDEGIEEVLALAPATPPAQLEVTPAPTTEESESATSAITEEIPS